MIRWISCLLTAGTMVATAQTRLLQNFEQATFPPAGWTLQYSGIQYWERANIGGYSTSSGSAVFRFYDASGFEIQSLLSSTFAPSVAGDSLGFDHAYATYQNEVDSLIIETSSDGGSSFARLTALAGGTTVGTGMVTAPPSFSAFTPTGSQWRSKSFALPAGTNKIRFTAKSAYGNNLYLDNITVGQPYIDDVGVAGILSPRFFINFPFTETPSATIKNYGSANQAVSFSTEITITGPGGFFYSAATLDTLSAGLSRTIAFNTPFNPTQAGSYTVSCYTQLVSDQARSNDTVTTTVTGGNYNYGTNGSPGSDLYFFANSLTGTGAPAQPRFGWRDTSGSTDLIVNGIAVSPITGDIDDGFFKLTGVFPGRNFRLFGTDYSDSVFIGTNGIISFREGYDSFLPSAIPSGLAPNAALYPFWMDLDFSDPDVPVNRLSYKIDGDLLIVTYARAPRYDASAATDDFVSFQVCMRFSSSGTSNTFVSVQFDSSQTGSSFMTAYESHVFPHLIGAENNDGTSAVTYRFVDGGAPIIPGPVLGSSLALTFGPAYDSYTSVSLRAFLEGAYSQSSHAMRTDLTALLPRAQPYRGLPWAFNGSETISSVPATMVDWVLLDLRSGTSSASRAASRAALLMSDGSITDIDGASPVKFDLLQSGSYYIVLSHHNHLAIMSSGALALSQILLTYSFSTGQGQAYGTQPMNLLEGGVFGMVAGDANTSTIISTADANSIFGFLSSPPGYSALDINLSGLISTADANIVFRNLGRTSQVPGAAASPARELELAAARRDATPIKVNPGR